MAIQQGLEVVDRLLHQQASEGAFFEEAKVRARAAVAASGAPGGMLFGVDNCDTRYGANATDVSLELISWHLSILLAEYTAGILALKTEEGHCREHRPAQMLPCGVMAREHLRMLAAFNADLKQLVAEIDERIETLRAGLAG